jgi:hypothetical protein
MSYAAKIIDKFGGTRKLAAAIDLPPSTVQSWKDTGLIPAKHQQVVLDKARETNIDLTPDDFFETPESSTQPQAAA